MQSLQTSRMVPQRHSAKTGMCKTLRRALVPSSPASVNAPMRPSKSSRITLTKALGHFKNGESQIRLHNPNCKSPSHKRFQPAGSNARGKTTLGALQLLGWAYSKISETESKYPSSQRPVAPYPQKRSAPCNLIAGMAHNDV